VDQANIKLIKQFNDFYRLFRDILDPVLDLSFQGTQPFCPFGVFGFRDGEDALFIQFPARFHRISLYICIRIGIETEKDNGSVMSQMSIFFSTIILKKRCIIL
jgi:hypothetical protein